MNRFIASAGFIAVGAASLQGAYAPSLSSVEASKSFSVSATLRGFYDDNYATASSRERDSFGFEISPGFEINLLPSDQTLFRAGYTYSLRWYEERDRLNKNASDQSHRFHLSLSHAFSERFTLEVTDQFAIAQEPELLDPTGTGGRRANGSNIRNSGAINANVQLSERLSLVLGYQNNFYDYNQTTRRLSAGTSNTPPTFVAGRMPSYSGLLDRLEHVATINLRLQVLPKTTGVLGYQYGINQYTGDEPIVPVVTTVPGGNILRYTSSDRDSTSHYMYAGADQSFTRNLTGSARVGAQLTEFDSPRDAGKSDWSPYLQASLNYVYAAGSSVTVGAQHQRNATDVVQPDGNGFITTDAQATSAYVSIAHQLTSKLTLGAMGSWTLSEFQGGASDGGEETYWLAGLNLTYQINPFLSAEAGYNYDQVESDLTGRGFMRNRLYLGLTGKY